MKTVLSIAGSDSSGGAGIQADIKTMISNGVYAMTAITALTAQNTTGVQGIMEVTGEFLKEQLDSVFTDIRPDAVKTGMIPNASLMEVVAERLAFYQADNIVIDPVMVATSGSSLMQEQALATMKEKLFPLATLVTPNIPEAEALSGKSIQTTRDMEEVAKELFLRFGCSVLVKGGHSIHDANDVLCSKEGICWFEGRRIDNPNTHGTGCTLSSAIASNLAKGSEVKEAVGLAKEYISGALEANLNLGKGHGPLHHGYAAFSQKNSAPLH